MQSLSKSSALEQIKEELAAICKYSKDYNENNADSVESYLEDAFLFSGLLDGHVYKVGPYGHGFTESDKTGANAALMALKQKCEANGCLKELQRELNDMVEYNGRIEKFSEAYDKEDDLIVMEYETEDMEEEQVDDALAAQIRALSPAEMSELEAFLDEKYARLECSETNCFLYCGDVHARWRFTISVRDLEDAMDIVIERRS
jgi:hypothetical protein